MNQENQENSFTCCECHGYVNFSSEGQTYDYSENEKGEAVYLCQECLERLHEQAEGKIMSSQINPVQYCCACTIRRATKMCYECYKDSEDCFFCPDCYAEHSAINAGEIEK